MAELVLRERKQLSVYTFIEMKLWRVPKATEFPDGVKYSMVLIHKRRKILGYDNERAKGHHRHFMGTENKVKFTSIEKLKSRFLQEVKKLREELE